MAGISAKNIRNIALLGHGGEGKTTLAEAILFNAKAIDRQGRVDDGNTTMDFDPEEIGKKISISLATANATFKGVKLNLIDVPGFFDFEGEFVQAMTVADCALVVTGPGGTLPVGTEKALDYCVAHKVPTMIFINGMDKENANYWDTVNAVSQKYSTKIVPLMIPLMENGKMTGYANVLEGLFYKVGAHGENGQPLPDSLKSKYDELKGVVMEKAAESDEELLMKFFDSGELSAEEMVKGMKQGVKEGAAIGVFGGSALANFGVFNLMNNLISMMPSAAEAKPVVAFDENDKPTELKPDENAPVVIRIFKTIADPFVGRLSLFKVVSGTLKSGLTLKNASKDSEEKISSIYFLKGKKQETVDAACAGDIGALAKLSNATTGDTLSEGRELRLPPIELPKPVLSMAVYAAKKGDEDKIFGGLNRLKDEDISFTVTKNAETNEMLLSGVGETQLEILCRKLKNKFGVEAVLKEPRIAYRETIKKMAEAEGKHKKQSGGAGQFGQCSVRFEPGAADGQFEFVDAVVGGAVPRQFIPAVEKGLREAIKEGVLAGYPMVDLKCTLFDGKSHPVDSKEVAFVSAAKLAYAEGVAKAAPAILEPIYQLKITVPESFMGDILGDMNKRRGRILGMEMVDGKQVINAECPLAEVLKYATDLRSMTQGRGSYEMEFVRYEEVPATQVPKIIEDAKKQAAEKE
ncbi:MAG TPA: elongation factor G [Clostridiales bacterium]|jgi:translation elongation factor 2 (EF-2/EF-G)|nr:MAG: elongation factor G [Subdoligranulum sp.]HCW81697.1 elongation factor G [Clostridiales bacterium]